MVGSLWTQFSEHVYCTQHLPYSLLYHRYLGALKVENGGHAPTIYSLGDYLKKKKLGRKG